MLLYVIPKRLKALGDGLFNEIPTMGAFLPTDLFHQSYVRHEIECCCPAVRISFMATLPHSWSFSARQNESYGAEMAAGLPSSYDRI